jgi:hypothetical protein
MNLGESACEDVMVIWEVGRREEVVFGIVHMALMTFMSSTVAANPLNNESWLALLIFCFIVKEDGSGRLQYGAKQNKNERPLLKSAPTFFLHGYLFDQH